MKVIISKVDLDTTMTALILGVSEDDNICVRNAENIISELDDPEVLCIESGGSGMLQKNNFDHHDLDVALPPACKQAYDHTQPTRNEVAKLVKYICMVDLAEQFSPAIEFPSLANIFSGLLLERDSAPVQLLDGINLLKTFLDHRIDPFAVVPILPEWQKFYHNKTANYRRVRTDMRLVKIFYTNKGRTVGALRTKNIGGTGHLYQQGCNIVIFLNTHYGNPPVNKYTLASPDVHVADILPYLNTMEQGWGGHLKIIGSPYQGSSLDMKTISQVVKDHL